MTTEHAQDTFKGEAEALAAGWRRCGTQYGDKDYSRTGWSWDAAIGYPGRARASVTCHLSDIPNRYGGRGVLAVLMPPMPGVTLEYELAHGPWLRQAEDAAEMDEWATAQEREQRV